MLCICIGGCNAVDKTHNIDSTAKSTNVVLIAMDLEII